MEEVAGFLRAVSADILAQTYDPDSITGEGEVRFKGEVIGSWRFRMED
jgi:hypothetical protein